MRRLKNVVCLRTRRRKKLSRLGNTRLSIGQMRLKNAGLVKDFTKKEGPTIS
jgi:hypothetical protein